MKRFLLLAVLTILCFAGKSYSQDYVWKYDSAISFPTEDSSIVQPFLCSIDARNRLYVLSSKVVNGNAHNSIYYADSADTHLTKLIDFRNNADTIVIGALRGIACIGNDVFFNASQVFAYTGNTVSAIYRIKGGDTTKIEKFGYNMTGAGYGTFTNGMAVSKDTITYCGCDFNTSIRFYNFNSTIPTPGYGSWVPITGTYPVEPGGAHDATGFDVIRDVATIPNADYNSSEVPFYTARSSSSTNTTSGGIASWVGGDQGHPGNYVATRITDPTGLLTFNATIPYGITVDNSGNLWVAGTDSLKKWVKGFQISGALATEIGDLPCLNNMVNPDTAGAPIQAPADVVFSKSGTTAYVTDLYTKNVYKFKYTNSTAVKDHIVLNDFKLEQNYPNPFNPSTIISYTLPKSGNVRLVVANVLGRQVAVLTNGYQASGTHAYSFDGKNLSSGVYFYSLTTEAGTICKKMMLVK